MKTFLLAAAAAALALACAPSLSGCATSSGSPSASTALQTEAQALNDAEAAYTGAATVLDQAALSGVLKGQAAASAKSYLDAAHTALVGLRAAYAAANAKSFAAQLVDLNAAVAAVTAITRPSPS